jgi:hypothetical protein
MVSPNISSTLAANTIGNIEALHGLFIDLTTIENPRLLEKRSLSPRFAYTLVL